MTPDQRDAILDSLQAGCSLAQSCKAARVSPDVARTDDDIAEALELADLAAHEAPAPPAPDPDPPRTTYAPVQIPTLEPYLRVALEAARFAPGHFGILRWIDSRCDLAGMHGLDAWWLEAFRLFYESRKMVFAARVGLRGAKSVSCCRPLVCDALFLSRTLDPETVGVVPIMSSDRNEATDRFVAIKAVLRAIGVRPAKDEDDDGAQPGGLGSEYTSATLPSGGGVIRTTDSQGHRIEFRIYPAAKRSAVGFTGIAGMADELDMWRDKATNANPAEEVMSLLFKRYGTQPTARLYVVSASYHATSTHRTYIDRGDTDLFHVARLGVAGAERDEYERRWLAMNKGGDDPRLTARADPRTHDIPAWVTNPAQTIEACFRLSRNLDEMLALYGGRAHEAGGKTSQGGQCIGLAEAVEAMLGPQRRDPWGGFGGAPPSGPAML